MKCSPEIDVVDPYKLENKRKYLSSKFIDGWLIEG